MYEIIYGWTKTSIDTTWQNCYKFRKYDSQAALDSFLVSAIFLRVPQTNTFITQENAYVVSEHCKTYKKYDVSGIVYHVLIYNNVHNNCNSVPDVNVHNSLRMYIQVKVNFHVQ
jgi:hypothetical protein